MAIFIHSSQVQAEKELKMGSIIDNQSKDYLTFCRFSDSDLNMESQHKLTHNSVKIV